MGTQHAMTTEERDLSGWIVDLGDGAMHSLAPGDDAGDHFVRSSRVEAGHFRQGRVLEGLAKAARVAEEVSTVARPHSPAPRAVRLAHSRRWSWRVAGCHAEHVNGSVFHLPLLLSWVGART